MLEQYFWTAFHPIGPESERPITGTNEVYLPGVFGDIFDVIFAYPDVNKWKTIDSYPVVVATGDIELSEAEGKRLADYVNRGGTLVIADAHLTGPGVASLAMPATSPEAQASGYKWLEDGAGHSSQAFRYREIPLDKSLGKDVLRPLAKTLDGKCFCAAIDRDAGRIIYLSVPRGLGIDKSVHPVVPRLLAHLSRGQMPLEVSGEVEWLVNRAPDKWLLTLMNPQGQDKPQHGITPTDYRKNKQVTIRCRVPVKEARDRLLPEDSWPVVDSVISLEVPAGGVRIVEIK
jgi:hypothetical protein